jgi:bacteriocin-like protein
MTRARELTETENKQRELTESELDAVSGGTKSGGTVAAGWDIKANKRV